MCTGPVFRCPRLWVRVSVGVEIIIIVIIIVLIIIMYTYHALSNALSAHIIHINLNMMLYTHVEHSPTKTIYIKY